ncbi:adenosine receptor A1-like [Pygocentrus nattereri]|uniref:adenosine receptor A1-like n=1 Tax=Pygocentrus nattereri TaxID=42514 RepID=UPI001891370C|nr:adenosine receptor A1-like [Pygocentrus nattereri]
MKRDINNTWTAFPNASTQPVSPKFLQWPYIAAEIMISIISTSGNLLVCLAVGCNKKLQNVTNYFLVSLSVADFFVGTLAIPCAIMTDLGLPHHNLYLCIAILYMLLMLTQSSIFSLLAVAIERYVAILLPFQYQRLLKPRNARLVILLTWLLAFLVGSVPLMGWHGRSDEMNYCSFACVVDMAYMVYFNFFGCVLVPLVTMFIIYTHIFVTVRRHVRRTAAMQTALELQARQNTGMRDEARKATSIFVLVFVFALCWIPLYTVNCVHLFCPHCKIPLPLSLITIILSHANSAINPLLYAYKLKSFRDAFKAIFLCCRMTSPVPDSTDSNGTSRHIET